MVCFAISPSAHQLKSEGELPERTILFMNNSSGKDIDGYAIKSAATDTVKTNTWAFCNIYDGKAYGLCNFPKKVTNLIAPVYGVYKFRRIN